MRDTLNQRISKDNQKPQKEERDVKWIHKRQRHWNSQHHQNYKNIDSNWLFINFQLFFLKHVSKHISCFLRWYTDYRKCILYIFLGLVKLFQNVIGHPELYPCIYEYDWTDREVDKYEFGMGKETKKGGDLFPYFLCFFKIFFELSGVLFKLTDVTLNFLLCLTSFICQTFSFIFKFLSLLINLALQILFLFIDLVSCFLLIFFIFIT